MAIGVYAKGRHPNDPDFDDSCDMCMGAGEIARTKAEPYEFRGWDCYPVTEIETLPCPICQERPERD